MWYMYRFLVAGELHWNCYIFLESFLSPSFKQTYKLGVIGSLKEHTRVDMPAHVCTHIRTHLIDLTDRSIYTFPLFSDRMTHSLPFLATYVIYSNSVANKQTRILSLTWPCFWFPWQMYVLQGSAPHTGWRHTSYSQRSCLGSERGPNRKKIIMGLIHRNGMKNTSFTVDMFQLRIDVWKLRKHSHEHCRFASDCLWHVRWTPEGRWKCGWPKNCGSRNEPQLGHLPGAGQWQTGEEDLGCCPMHE